MSDASIPFASPITVDDSLRAAVRSRVDDLLRKNLPRGTSFGWETEIWTLLQARYGLLRTSLCLDDVLEEVLEAFGLDPGVEWWTWFWEVVEREDYTLGDLADLIANRIAAGRVRAIDIAGALCAKAGAFRSIQMMLCEASPIRSRKVKPSDDVHGVLSNGEIVALWHRIDSTPGVEVPELRRTKLTVLRDAAGYAAVVSFLLIFIVWILSELMRQLGIARASWEGAAAITSYGLVGITVLGFIASFSADAFDNRLPNGIRTFRDLATRMARGAECR